MSYSLKQRFNMWLCTKLGHRYDISTLRVYNNTVICDCIRCNLTLAKKLKNE